MNRHRKKQFFYFNSLYFEVVDTLYHNLSYILFKKNIAHSKKKPTIMSRKMQEINLFPFIFEKIIQKKKKRFT